MDSLALQKDRQTGFAEGGLAGSGEAGSSPRCPRGSYVGSGRCFVVSGSLVSHPTGEGSGFKIRGVLVCR